jgi:hypothetical protein
VQPLPDYTRRKPLAGGRWGYYFEPPTWARKPKEADDRGPCPVGAEELGIDYVAAVKRAENVLLPLFDSWRTRGAVDMVPTKGTRRGSLDWLLEVYRADDKFKILRPKVKRIYNQGFDLVGGHVLKDGRRLGDVAVTSIDTNKVDKLYKKLLVLHDGAGNPVPLFPPGSLPDQSGEPLYAERRTSVNNAMKYCRRAWNVVRRLHPKDVPSANPFAGMGLVSRSKEVEAATYADLLAAVAQADAMGLPSLGTALMMTWEWLQREEHIFTTFMLEHYRPRHRPNEVFIIDHKTRPGEKPKTLWIPLFNEAGAALFPELMARMDAVRRNRIGNGLLFMRDWVDHKAGVPLPWATPRGQIDMVGKKLRPVLDAAGIDAAISFTSFRHGGLTECGDGDLTDTQIRAISRHKSSKVLTRYVKRTAKQIIDGTHKRRAVRPARAVDDSQLDLFGMKGR